MCISISGIMKKTITCSNHICMNPAAVLVILALTALFPGQLQCQGLQSSWDDTLSKAWPGGFHRIQIISSADSSLQNAWFYASPSPGPAPLIVSLHTWSGDYMQEDPLAAEIIQRGWNYIHPDFRGPNNSPEACGSDLVVSDLQDAIEYALRNSTSDPEDIHIIGVSGGGYATLTAYMKLNYRIRSFNAWASISDLAAWYKECRSRHLKYAEDIEKVTSTGEGFNLKVALERSPVFMTAEPDLRNGSFLNIYAGVNDGYSGSVPVSHSVGFYNKIISDRYAARRDLMVSDSTLAALLARRVNPDEYNGITLGGRNVYLSAGTGEVNVTVFEGGHEMLVPQALSLIPVRRSYDGARVTGKVLVIGDSNGAAENGWPVILGKLLPGAIICNASLSGNTIGFDNLDREELNTLKNIDRYIDEAVATAFPGILPGTVIIALGTNDTKRIFIDRQKEVAGNMSLLIERIRARLPGVMLYIISPPPMDEAKLNVEKYGGGDARVSRLVKQFRVIAKTGNTGFIDIYSLLKPGFSESTADGVHLNEKAQYLTARYIAGEMCWDNAGMMTETGRMVPSGTIADSNVVIPPAWAFGVLYGGYTDQQQTVERIGDILAHDYPIDAYWIDSWFWSFRDRGAGPGGYLDFRGDTISFPDRRGMWLWMQEKGIKGGFWIWDCIQERGNEDIFDEFLREGCFSSVYLNKNPWHNTSTTTAMYSLENKNRGTLCGNIDFDNPEAVKMFRMKIGPFFEEGADFLKLDRSSGLPFVRAMYNITAGEGKETAGRGFILSHSGGTESNEYKRYPAKWTDDTRADWTVLSPVVSFNSWVPPVALRENVFMFTRGVTAGIPFLTNDLGGFDMGSTDRSDGELYIRWMQFSMFCPLTEVFSQPENPTSNLAWKYSPAADTLFRFYSHLRLKLFPYIYANAHLSRIEGRNIIRPVAGYPYEYFFGEDMVVSPVLVKQPDSVTVGLPGGTWIDYWSGREFIGSREIVIPATLEKIPLFIRKGALIPERPYASSVEAGSNDTLWINVYPGENGVFRLIEDDGTSNDYLKGGFAVTLLEMKTVDNGFDLNIKPVEGSYNGMDAYRYWGLRVHSLSSSARVVAGGRRCTVIHDDSERVTLVMPVRAERARGIMFRYRTGS